MPNTETAASNFQPLASGGVLGSSISYASPAGASHNLNPSGFGAGVGAILVSLAGGAANWTGLTAGAEGQTVRIINTDAANTLTLNNLNAGSFAANRFQGGGDFVLLPNTSVLLQYRGALNSGAGAWSVG